MVRVIVAGSRTFTDFKIVEQNLLTYFKKHNLHHQDVEIICGECRGADLLGKQFAEKKNCKITFFLADWNTYGKSAGPIRNEQMAKYAKEQNGILFAFWDGKSKGTKSMIDLSKKYQLEIHIIEV